MGVPAAEFRTQDGRSSTSNPPASAYGALVGRAATLIGADRPSAEGSRAFRLIGRPLKRLDTPDKTNGQGEVRYRRAAAGREVRDPRREPRARRQGRPCR